MIDHFGINCLDLPASARFYDGVLGVLGHRRVMDFGVAIDYGTEGPAFWISTFDEVGPNREVHVAFVAPDAAAVQAFHAAALELGAEELHAPRLWPEYHPAISAPSCATPATQPRRSGLPHRRSDRLTSSVLAGAIRTQEGQGHGASGRGIPGGGAPAGYAVGG